MDMYLQAGQIGFVTGMLFGLAFWTAFFIVRFCLTFFGVNWEANVYAKEK